LAVRAFRFGYQVRATDADELVARAQTAEAAGFDVIHVGDHVDEEWSPLPALLAIALATQRVRICPLVLNNDFHHPVNLARDLAAIDRLTAGRLEVGIGAGHSLPEYTAIGASFDSPSNRKSRMAEALEIIRRLLDGETVTHHGSHYRIDGVRIMRALQDRVPILVGVNGRAALAHAARHADIIGLTMLGRTLEDGQNHETRWELDRLDRTVEHIRAAAGDHGNGVELNALIQKVTITTDRAAAAAEAVARRWTPALDDALGTPFLAFGTHEEIAEHLKRCRERWGISYFSVREVETFAPVISLLHGDAAS
jgi:probable F420-dependent oxidoreductase